MNSKKQLLPNPVDFLDARNHLPQPKFVCVTHGDMSPRNIFIDESLNAWLIDFFKTGDGPALRDIADLESSIKFQLLKSENLQALFEFERTLLAPTNFSEPIKFQNTFELPEFARALTAIEELRKQARLIAEQDGMEEYYASLLFFAAKMITWHGISSLETERQPVRQRHALFSAAMICERFLRETDNSEDALV